MENGVSTAKLNPDAEERFQLLRRELGVTSFGLNLMTGSSPSSWKHSGVRLSSSLRRNPVPIASR